MVRAERIEFFFLDCTFHFSGPFLIFPRAPMIFQQFGALQVDGAEIGWRLERCVCFQGL